MNCFPWSLVHYSARIQDHPRLVVDLRLGRGRPDTISGMTALEVELSRLERAASQLSELLATTTTKLPPAAIEDLRLALREVLNRLTGQVGKFLPGNFDRDVAQITTNANSASNASIYDQLLLLRSIADFLVMVITREDLRVRNRQVKGLVSVLHDIGDELEGCLKQLQERRLFLAISGWPKTL